MCGIVGFAANIGSSTCGVPLERARDLLRHRGPDDKGLYLSQTVGLGHRRLSIIDLEGGHQPMLSADGRVVLTYNGEIYNYRELRAELIQQGHVFRTQSDTEVLLNLYLEYGIDCVEKLNGIFAFAIQDDRDQRLYIARDQMGIKPLYYARTAEGLAFASEVKALLAVAAIKARLNDEALYEFLLFRDVSGEQTLFRDVNRLLPGHLLIFDGKDTVCRQYWSVVEFPRIAVPSTFEDAVTALDGVLHESIRDQLVSDVPVGTFCSGGIDSSLVTAIASEYATGELNTYSIAFDESEFDESEHSLAVSSRYGTRHHELRVSNSQFASALQKSIWHNDEPLHFPNSVQIEALSHLASENVTVVLTGEGADELFCGYPRYNLPLLGAIWRRVPGFLRSGVSLFGDHRIKKLEGVASRSLEQGILYNSASADGSRLVEMAGFSGIGKLEYRSGLLAETNSKHDAVERLMLLDQQTYMTSILNRQDKMSMAASIESRVPFLDMRVVQLANSLPLQFKCRRLENKRILKRVARDYLPDSVIDRRKSGFGVPLANWFRAADGLGALLKSRYEDPLVANLFSGIRMEEVHLQHMEGVEDHSDTLWAMLNLSLWREEFEVEWESGDFQAAF